MINEEVCKPLRVTRTVKPQFLRQKLLNDSGNFPNMRSNPPSQDKRREVGSLLLLEILHFSVENPALRTKFSIEANFSFIPCDPKKTSRARSHIYF